MTIQNGARLSRRRLLVTAAAALGVTAFPSPFIRRASAQDAFPSRDLNVIIPTSQGGVVDRVGRAVAPFWSKNLGVNIEFDYINGASGEIAYQTLVDRRDADGHNLLLGNVGNEMVMYATRDTAFDFPGDVTYIARTDIDDSAIFVRNESPFQTIEDLVEEGQTRALNVGTARLPHPASIGVLALGEATGAQFNIVPYGGGNPMMVAALSGETDCTTSAISLPAQTPDQYRYLGVFSTENRFSALMGNAPSVNEVFGTDIPDLPSARGIAIQTSVLEEQADRVEILLEALRSTYDDPGFRADWEKTGAPWEIAQFGDQAAIMAYANDMRLMAENYRSLLTSG